MLERKRWNYAVWLARQAVEKIFKACYPALLGRPTPMGHNLLLLAEEVFDQIPLEIREHLSFLNPHYVTARYANASLGLPSEIYDENFSKEAIRRAEEVLKWADSRLKE